MPGLVLADDLSDLQPRDVPYQQHIKQAVVWLRLRQRVESAAVVAPVGDAGQRVFAVEDLTVDGDAVVLMYAPEKIDQDGENVCPGTGHEREPGVAVHAGADAGVKADGADIQCPVLAALDEVKLHRLAVQQPGSWVKAVGSEKIRTKSLPEPPA